ncbi:MAG: c-type cytochrome [Acidobacteria bacterium]|nr:c-type cytochrome [Acidobacteriota bacterium]
MRVDDTRAPRRSAGNPRRWLIAAALVLSVGAPASGQEGTDPGDPRLCIACHAVLGTPAVPGASILAAQRADYLYKQLKDYRSGRRPSAVMVPVLGVVGGSQLKEIAAFFAKQAPVPGIVEDPSLLPAGKQLYENGNAATGVPNCMGCHQADGGGSPNYPRIAGQMQSYVTVQMDEFRKGTRANDRAGVMRLVASRMTDSEIKAVAEYIASLSHTPE